MRKPRDTRTLTTGFGSTNFEYRELTTSDWIQIQQRFGKGFKISDAARVQLNGVTVHYSIHGQSARRVKSLNAVSGQIKKWETQTNILRNFVWTTERESNSQLSLPLSLESLLKQYFHSKATDREKLYPLAHLARLLDGARAIASYFIGKIGDIQNDNNNVEASVAWAALVISICHRNALPVMVFHGKTRKFHSGFVELLDRLQNVLNPEVQPDGQSNKNFRRSRRQGKSSTGQKAVNPKRWKRSSLKKLALQAYDISQGSQAEELFVLLSYWGIGQTQISNDMIFGIDTARLKAIQAQLRSLKRAHRVEKNVTKILK